MDIGKLIRNEGMNEPVSQCINPSKSPWVTKWINVINKLKK